MLAFPSMLVGPAQDAGMKTPNLDKTDKWDANEYPHFTVFANIQLCRRMNMDGEQWRNAKVIAAIPEDKIKQISLNDLLAIGIEWQQ